MNELRKYTAGVAFGCVLAYLANGHDARPVIVAADIAPAPSVETPPSVAGVESSPAIPPAADEVTETPKPTAKSLRDAIRDYRQSGGVRYYVKGKTDAQHLTQDHGWTQQQIAGLSGDELQFLHGATHVGAIKPGDFPNVVAGTPTVTPFTPAESPSSVGGSTRPKIRIISPATWDCGYCPGHRNQDWSAFDATFEKRDGLPSYPATEWVDARGVTRRLYGQRTPNQVRWSWERTQ